MCPGAVWVGKGRCNCSSSYVCRSSCSQPWSIGKALPTHLICSSTILALGCSLNKEKLSVGSLCRGFTHQAESHGWRHEGLRGRHWPMASWEKCQEHADKGPSSYRRRFLEELTASLSRARDVDLPKHRSPDVRIRGHAVSEVLSGKRTVLELQECQFFFSRDNTL